MSQNSNEFSCLNCIYRSHDDNQESHDMVAYELVETKTEISFHGHNIGVETAEKCRNEEEGLLDNLEHSAPFVQ